MVRYGRFITFLTVLLAATTACGALRYEAVRLSFDNRTDSVLCFDLSPEDAAAGPCSQEVKPLATTNMRPGCAYGSQAERAPVTIVITVKQGGRQIYNKTAECRVWQDSDRTFVIEQRGDEFVVTDPLSGAGSSGD